MDELEETAPVPRSRLSKTPSWITLGFVLGALFVWALPRDEKPAGTALSSDTPPRIVQLERPKLTEVEAVFVEWERYAVWKNNVTQIALWDTEKRSYSIFYEVFRQNGDFYFRSIPQLTRPLLTRGVPTEAPLQFAETEESRRAWIEHGQFEPRAEPSPRTE
ncbi:MAG: hypothetical protein ABIZ04_23975 [Opitutus sp.]